MLRVVRCSSRDALETADASRRVLARDSKSRREEDWAWRGEIPGSRTGWKERRKERARERERERSREIERECGMARDNVNVCVVAPKHSQDGRRLSVFRLYRKNGFVSRVRRTSRSLRGLPQWTSINFQAFPRDLVSLLSVLRVSVALGLPSSCRGNVNGACLSAPSLCDPSLCL